MGSSFYKARMLDLLVPRYSSWEMIGRLLCRCRNVNHKEFVYYQEDVSRDASTCSLTHSVVSSEVVEEAVALFLCCADYCDTAQTCSIWHLMCNSVFFFLFPADTTHKVFQACTVVLGLFCLRTSMRGFRRVVRLLSKVGPGCEQKMWFEVDLGANGDEGERWLAARDVTEPHIILADTRCLLVWVHRFSFDLLW